jgi:hypothetical protein
VEVPFRYNHGISVSIEPVLFRYGDSASGEN